MTSCSAVVPQLFRRCSATVPQLFRHCSDAVPPSSPPRQPKIPLFRRPPHRAHRITVPPLLRRCSVVVSPWLCRCSAAVPPSVPPLIPPLFRRGSAAVLPSSQPLFRQPTLLECEEHEGVNRSVGGPDIGGSSSGHAPVVNTYSRLERVPRAAPNIYLVHQRSDRHMRLLPTLVLVADCSQNDRLTRRRNFRRHSTKCCGKQSSRTIVYCSRG